MATIIISPDGEHTVVTETEKDTATVINGPPIGTAPTTEVAKAEDADKEKRYVAITLTDELREALDQQVPSTTTWGLWCRQVIAEKLGVTITVSRNAPRGDHKDETAEEKAARLDKARIDRATFLERLKGEHEARIAGKTPEEVTAAGDAFVAAWVKRDAARQAKKAAEKAAAEAPKQAALAI